MTTELARARPSARVDKPWGHEEIFAQVEGSYVGKTPHVNGGESLSLQWHHEKDETIAVLSGQVEIDLGTSEDALRAVAVAPGESVHITPGLLHRVRAITDSVPSRPPRPRPAGGRTSSASTTATAAAAPKHPEHLLEEPHERSSHRRRPGQPRRRPGRRPGRSLHAGRGR